MTSAGPNVRAAITRDPALMDLPKEIVANIVRELPYAVLPAFRTTCKLARELVDATSNGWVMKVEEGEALQTSDLLQRLTSLCYMWFENWTWQGDQEANFLAVILTNLSVFARLQEVRFPGTTTISLRCLRGLMAALPSVISLTLPPLPASVVPDSPHYAAAFACISARTSLTDLNLEGWALTDAAASALGSSLTQLKRLSLGNASVVTRDGFQAIARLTGLKSLVATGVRGSNATVEPLEALSCLTGLRLELAPGFSDSDPGPLARMPHLRSLGWWHAELQPAAGLRAGSIAPWLKELSLCFDLDSRALGVLAACTGLTMMQVQTITLPTTDARPPAPAPASAREAAPAGPDKSGAPASSSPLSSFSLAMPVLPSLRTLILGELALPPAAEPQPAARLADLFPALENLLVFQVAGRGLLQLDRAARLKRLVLNAAHLTDEMLGHLPALPSLQGLQLESCQHLTDASVAALRAVPDLHQLFLFNTPTVTDAFLSEASGLLRSVRTLVLSQLPNVHDDGLQKLTALAGTLENLELRGLPAVTPAGLEVVHQLPNVGFVAVSQCAGVEKAACRQLAAALAAAGRDVTVEHETTILMPMSLADDFGEQPEGAQDANQQALPG